MFRTRLLLYSLIVVLIYFSIQLLLRQPKNNGSQENKEIISEKDKKWIFDRVSTFKQKGRKIKLNIAVVTEFKEFGSFSKENFKTYASRHGYKFIVGDEMRFEDQSMVTNNSGLKYQIIQQVMKDDPSLDWIFWCSPDSLILNHSIHLESILDERYLFILPLSPKDIIKDIPQTDHLLVRNTPQGRKIIDDLVSMSTRNCGFFLLEYPASSFAIDGWLHICENDGNFWNGDVGMLLALYVYRESEYRCLIKRIGERMFSSRYPRYGPGDFVLGFGEEKDLSTRQTLLKGALKYADVERGVIDRKRTESLEPSVDPGEGSWEKLEEMYAKLNIPCDQIYNRPFIQFTGQ